MSTTDIQPPDSETLTRTGAHNHQEKDSTAVLHNILGLLVDDSRRREKSLRRDVWFRRVSIGLLVGASLVGYYSFFKGLVGPGAGKTDGPTMAVVDVRGAIMPDSALASGEVVGAAITKAAKDPNVKRIVLYVESPGGAPVEAERIMQAVDNARTTYKKPITAVIGNLGASAGYMVALSADEIVSGRYSLVGSIGAVIQSWQLTGLLDKLDVRAKSFASGELKTLLNPYEPPSAKAAAKAQELVDTLGGQFAQLVKDRRGDKLKRDIGTYTSGEVWNGEQALALGLVDATGTLESVAAAHPDLKVVDFSPRERKGLVGQLTGAVSSGIAQGLSGVVQNHSALSVQ